ncbi:hypothetical protein FRC04_011609 [Tulasnella sp. 424]|nr:hypothetical protein FRC04_011609 [Tulasnella sp. 424]
MERLNADDSGLKQSDYATQGTCSGQSQNPADQDLFSRLPNEILETIFYPFVTSWTVPLWNHRAPTLLIPVCRRFRDIVYGSPKLWTMVTISERGGFRHLPDYLARSAGMPIDVTMYPLDDQYTNTFLRRAAPILAESHRWRVVEFGMLQAWRTPKALLPALDNAPILSSLSIRQTGGSFNHPVDGLKYVIPEYPNLRSLDIITIDVDFNAIAATNLLELCAKVNLTNDHAYHAFSVFINRNVSLLQVQLDMRLWEEQDETSSPKPLTAISLPALTVFKANIPSQIAMNAFIHILDTPKLVQLSIRPPDAEFHPKADLTEFIPTCVKKFEALKEIKLDRFSSESYQVVEEDFKTFGLRDMDINVWVDRENLMKRQDSEGPVANLVASSGGYTVPILNT